MKKTQLGVLLAAAGGISLLTGCVSSIQSKAENGDIGSMKKMSQLYDGQRVYVYDPKEVPIIGAFSEASIGVPGKDAKQSFAWMKKAADKGDAWAMFTCGRFCGEGYGVPKSPKEAAVWFDKAMKASADGNLKKDISKWITKNLSSESVIDYSDVAALAEVDVEYIWKYIKDQEQLKFDDKVKIIDKFGKYDKNSFDGLMQQGVTEFYFKCLTSPDFKQHKLFGIQSGISFNLSISKRNLLDYDELMQMRKAGKPVAQFKKEPEYKVSDQGSFFGVTLTEPNEELYLAANIADSEMSELYEDIPTQTSGDVAMSMFQNMVGSSKKAVIPIVFSKDFDKKDFRYPDSYIFGYMKKFQGVAVQELINKLKETYKNSTVKQLADKPISQILTGTMYRVTYKQQGYRLENDDVFIDIKTLADKKLLEPKLSRIQPDDLEYKFAIIIAKLHANFAVSDLKGYSQKSKDEKNAEEEKAFEKFVNREISVADVEKQLAETGMVQTLGDGYANSPWHRMMEMKKNYPLKNNQDVSQLGLVGLQMLALSSAGDTFTPKKEAEDVIIATCFDKEFHKKAMEQYGKIRKALNKRAEMKKEAEREKTKSGQLNF